MPRPATLHFGVPSPREGQPILARGPDFGLRIIRGRGALLLMLKAGPNCHYLVR